MTSYDVFKMEIPEIIECHKDILRKNAEEMASVNRKKRQEARKKQTINALLALAAFIVPGLIFYALIELNPTAEIGPGIMALGLIVLLGFIFMFRAIRLANTAKQLERLTNINDLILILAEQTKRTALDDVLSKNWLCPYCAAPNSIYSKNQCTQCGKPYDKAATENYVALAKRNNFLPPSLK